MSNHHDGIMWQTMPSLFFIAVQGKLLGYLQGTGLENNTKVKRMELYMSKWVTAEAKD